MAAVSVSDAIARILASTPQTQNETITLRAAAGRILRLPVDALRDQPPCDVSAMDGFAVRDEMTRHTRLRIIGESRAGHAFEGRLGVDEAVRIFTGAAIPTSAKRVILQENVASDRVYIGLRPDSNPGGKSHIRPQGCDFRAGESLLQAGQSLDAWRLGLAAASGHALVTVARKPKVMLLCCGDELVSVDQVANKYQIFESNSYTLAELITVWGGMPELSDCISDDVPAILKQIASSEADIFVTVGGASVGDYDLVRSALERLSIRWAFEKVDVRPGKPTAFGILPDGRCVLCLPGNPTSAMICAQLFLKPLLQTALGAQPMKSIEWLPCVTELPANGPRETYLLSIRLAGPDQAHVLVPLSDQDSSRLLPFSQANALIQRPAAAPVVPIGTLCPFFSLERT